MSELTAKQQKSYDTYIKNDYNISKASRELGCNITTLKKTLFACARKGKIVAPDTYCEQAPAGFELTKSTIQSNAKGDIVQRWDRVSPFEKNLEGFIEYLKDRTPVLTKRIKKPKNSNENLSLEWLLYDHHHGMHSWAKQTGSDYDLNISSELMVKAAKKVFSNVGNVAETVIVLGGDNFHFDNRSGTTEKSGHALDVDGRYQKVLTTMYASIVTAIDNALLCSDRVKVVVLSGNHDYHSAIALSVILEAHYKDGNGRVVVDDCAAKHRYHQWGKNYFMYTHGDTGSGRLAGYMLQHVIRNDIRGVRNLFVRKGHLHKQNRSVMPSMDEIDGVIVETFPTLAGPDAFATDNAYFSNRATVANLWHKKYGQRSRLEISASELIE